MVVGEGVCVEGSVRGRGLAGLVGWEFVGKGEGTCISISLYVRSRNRFSCVMAALLIRIVGVPS